ncbi:MAG: reductive dehalogenase [Caldilineaceae bacterium]|nr:reductive dehalogenase [Caldilineaceae bacterium]MBP8106338.1 reductive dehalogenase [Caldilineaceae bacterium]MBP8125057.1 reductive dehalogenase [Caldilineaceae bacterium]MBP9074837.1 reductive dehalogenase [Caldilineaceae bacterium]
MADKGNLKLGRRDFLRVAGLGAGAAAVATVAKPTTVKAASSGGKFSDPAGRINRPWWVRTVDQPTIEIDWNVMQRYNERTGTVRGPGMAGYVGADEVDRLTAVAAKNELQRMLDNVDGYTLKDQALSDAHASLGWSFLGPQKAPTPEDRGVPKWTGSPEEAAKIIRAAMRHVGAATVGFIELDDNTRKLVYGVDPDGKDMIFTEDMVASETEDARYIPNSCKYAIAYTVQMSQETMRRCPTPLASQTTQLAYKRGQDIQASTQEFIRGLGYQCLGESSTNALAIAPAMAVMAGLGELSRLNRLITPEFGPMVRVFTLLTDLPVALDKPINAGIMEFCKRCKKCAEACPSESLSFDTEPTWETRGGWNNPGHKAYFEDATTCLAYWREVAGTNCGICFAVCPFAKKEKAWIHEWVKATGSVLPVADSFFRTMDDAFGYGVQANAEEWWGLDLPEFGIDTTMTVREG